ncbi:hypothetical protein [Streptomyces sp. NPDC001657]|uniref:hypothetical protein n=1 Tax=Streptomyces sp. NPDC001657 TaxID=3154522 RepID=UPI003316C8D0
MSKYHYIFIHPGYPVDPMIADISAACGVELRPAQDEFIDFSAPLDRAAVEVEVDHEYEEDHGIPFEKYDSMLTVRDFDRDIERQEVIAQQIFGNLAETGKYSLALVLDLQKLIDSAGPPL